MVKPAVVPAASGAKPVRQLRGLWLGIARTLIVILGGYGASAAIVGALSAAALSAGMARRDAVAIALMLGPVVLLSILLWGFAERRLGRLAFGLALLAAAGAGVARLIARGA